jgi:signal transduction histidine kinase
MYSTSFPEKKITLLEQVGFLCLFVAALYAVIDLFNFFPITLVSHLALFIGSFACVYLVKTGQTRIARTVLLLVINLVVFFITLWEPFETGTFLLFIPVAVGAFVVREYKQMKRSLMFSSLSIVLFYISVFGNTLQRFGVHRTDTYVNFIFGLNFLIAIISSLLVIYFVLRQSFASEESRKANEKMLEEKNAELTKVNNELDQFIYRTSHDLRSPLSSIMGLVNIAQKTDDTREIQLCLTLIATRAESQDTFIKEIIAYARNLRTEVHYEKINLTELIFLVVDELLFMDNAENIDFTVSTEEEVIIYADKFRTKSILINLIENAIKYRDSQKQSRIRVEIAQDSAFISVSIIDNGIGISKELMPKIFEMFYRANDHAPGSGLGLFIVNEIIKKLNGSICVESELGAGSNFTFSLPVRGE